MRKTLQTLSGVLCLYASIASASGGAQMIDDFQANPEQRWRFIADTVMGGASNGNVAFKTEGSRSFAHMTGNVSTKNNGGFIQIRRQLAKPPSNDTEGVRLVVRGNGQPYFLHLRTSGTILPWQYYQARFNTKEDWHEIQIPLARFKRSGWMLKKTVVSKSINSIAVVAFGRDHSADIQVRELGWY